MKTSLINPSHDLFISRHTCWFNQEKSFTAARNVPSPAQQLVISNTRSLPIQEKNRFIVINATIQALKLLIWNDTSSSTPEKGSSAARNEASPVQEMVNNLKDHIRIHSGEKPFNATIQSLELLIWREAPQMRSMQSFLHSSPFTECTQAQTL